MILSSKSSLNLDVSQTTLGQVEDFPKTHDFSPNPLLTAVVNEVGDHQMKRRKPHSTSGDYHGMTMPSMNEDGGGGQASFEQLYMPQASPRFKRKQRAGVEAGTQSKVGVHKDVQCEMMTVEMMYWQEQQLHASHAEMDNLRQLLAQSQENESILRDQLDRLCEDLHGL
jgi:hypothetical protein